jgi:hypothetical protein
MNFWQFKMADLLLSFDQTMNEEEENEPANDQAKTTKLTDFDKIAILEAVKNIIVLAYGRAVRVGQYLFLKILHCRLREKLHHVTWPLSRYKPLVRMIKIILKLYY